MTKFKSTNYSFEIELLSSLRDNYTVVKEQIVIKWTVGSEWFGAWLCYGLEAWGDPPFMLTKFKIM